MSDNDPSGDSSTDDSPENHVLASLQRRWEQEEQEEQEAKATFKSLCGRLREHGVEEVRIAYDGCGDSGVVEGVTASGGGQEIELDEPFVEALTEAAYGLLPGGWEINEGSFGELVLDVPTIRLVREHSWRIESTDYDEREIAL